ncbi:MAG: hypothetical protein H6948_12340 [Zoogloeaceae bacterium]|nr:hypothetical protein [Zoogloeaceae bacterium]
MLDNLRTRLTARRPDARLMKDHLGQLEARMARAAAQLLRRRQERIDAIGSSLAHLNPASVLARG